jgi:hypothetical protein
MPVSSRPKCGCCTPETMLRKPVDPTALEAALRGALETKTPTG